MSTDVNEFFTDLDAGVFEKKLSRALSDVAAGVIDHEKVGEVVIKLKLKPIGSYQIEVSQALTYTTPKRRGKLIESDETKTPMHVGKGGRLSFFPENQTQMFTKTGEVNRETGEITPPKEEG